MANKSDFSAEANTAEMLNLIAWYVDWGPGVANVPNAIAVVNADGTKIGALVPSGTGDVNLVEVGGSALAIGQALMVAGLPVSIASDQSAVDVAITANAIDFATETTLGLQSAKLPSAIGQNTKADSMSITPPTDADDVIIDTDSHSLDTFDATTGWAGSTDVSGLATSDDNFSGSKALTFDKSGTSEVLGSIIKTITSVDLRTHVSGHLIQPVIKLTSIAQVDHVFVRIGTDLSNYTEYRWEAADLVASWNVLALNIAQREDPITGTGIVSSAITYLEVGVVMGAAGNTLTGIVVDAVTVLHSLEANLRQAPTTEVSGPINLGSVTIKDRNSNRQMDVEADGANNAGHVMSNSLASEATLADVKTATETVAGSSPPPVSDAAWVSAVYVKASGGGAPADVDIGAGAPTNGQRWRIVALHPSVGGATVLTLTEEDGGVIEKWDFRTNGGTVVNYPPEFPDRMPTAATPGKKLLVTSSNDVAINIKYRMYDA